MTQEELSTLKELLIKAHVEIGEYQTYQVDGYIVVPIYWGEDDEDGIIIDEDSMRDEFEYFVDNELSMDFVEDNGR
jgi:hypothetical protein